ncbi:MAG: YiiD C-terminal domain-containing protein [Lacipirellulaceae bacterium]
MDDALLAELEATLAKHMPICTAMELGVEGWDGERLAMSMPLEPNRNHQYSAFAGSLSALCTITGWGTVFMLLKQKGYDGNIVIRRSTIRYRRPVVERKFVARGLPLESDCLKYFFELMESKNRSKIDVSVEIADDDGPFVTFTGSYVVQD